MSFIVTVSDLRQFEYCRRIVYFSYCVGLARRRPVTYKMEQGGLLHERVASLEERRTLRSYGLKEGERHFDIWLRSEKLGLSGKLDMVILTETEAIPVEFKNTENVEIGDNHRAQLAAYSLIIEEAWNRPVHRAFVHFIPSARSIEMEIDQGLKSRILLKLNQLRKMIAGENMPDATTVRGRCIDCEFRNFCPDVW